MTDHEAFAAQDAIDYSQICDLLTDASAPVLKQVMRDAHVILADREPPKQPPSDCFMNRLNEFLGEQQ